MFNLFNLINSRLRYALLLIIIFSIFLCIIELLIFSLLQVIIGYFLSSGITFKIESELVNALLSKFTNFESILIIFFVIFFFRSFLFIYVSLKKSKLIKNVNDDLSFRLYNNYLHQNFEFFINKKSSDFVSKVILEVNKFTYNVLDGIVYLITETFLIITILAFLLINYFSETIIFASIIFLFFSIFFKYYKNTFSNLGEKKSISDTKKIEDLQKSFYVIKSIKLDSLEKYFSLRFLKNTKISSHAQFFLSFVNDIPKPVAELIVSVIVFFILYILYYFFNMSKQEVLSMLGIFMVAMFRLLPSVNRIVGSINNIRFNYSSVHLISSELNSSISENQIKDEQSQDIKLEFKDSIFLKDISFNYILSKQYQLKNINIEIKKYSTIGIRGVSGSGKTTLLNLICGLLHPSSGEILVDGRSINLLRKSYQKKIGYVSQKIYLSDESIINNVIFGQDQKFFNYSLFDDCIKKSNLDDFIAKLPNGKDTIVGEMGSKLSGGQQQRIGIARALYKKPEILILDEATSALDDDAENEIIKTIGNLKGKITIIISSHQKKLLDCCDVQYVISDGRLIKA
jgi:ABC-type multidrug transport system fused ATPase/permease subunit